MDNTIKLSVVVPCLNQVRFVGETLQSICEQPVPVELIVIDGGSTDGTLDVIEQFRDHITHLVSEPDDGHYDAVNKGMHLATGDILCWLNADDKAIPGAYGVVLDIFKGHPEVEWLTGMPAEWDIAGRLVAVSERLPAYGRCYLARGEHDATLHVSGVQQESCFWRRALWDKVGGKIDISLDLAGDHDLWARMAAHADLYAVDTVFAGQRRHCEQRSARGYALYFEQVREIRLRRGGRLWLERLMHVAVGYRLKRCFVRLLFRGTGPVLTHCEDGTWLVSRRKVAGS